MAVPPPLDLRYLDSKYPSNVQPSDISMDIVEEKEDLLVPLEKLTQDELDLALTSAIVENNLNWIQNLKMVKSKTQIFSVLQYAASQNGGVHYQKIEELICKHKCFDLTDAEKQELKDIENSWKAADFQDTTTQV